MRRPRPHDGRRPRPGPDGRRTTHPCPTTRARSPSSKASKPSASGPACTSGPPASAACTTSSTRSSTTPSTRPWPATATPSSSRCWPTAACASRTTAVASRSTSSRARASPRSRSSSPCCTPAASSAAAATPCPAACTASASRWSTRCRPDLDVEVRREGHVYRQSYAYGVPDGAARARARPRPTPGTTVTFWADGDDLRDHDLRLLDPRAPVPGDGVPQQGAHAHASSTSASVEPIDRRRRAGGRGRSLREVSYHYEGGIADFVKYLNTTKGPAHQHVIHVENEDAERHDLRRGRDAVELGLLRVGPHLRQHDQHHRGRHARGGLPLRRSPRW